MAQAQGYSVVELCPAAPDREAKYFKEIFVSDTVKIPEQKPDKEKVVSIRKEIELIDVQTIEVELPNGETGNKIFVAGNIYLNVQYISTREDQTVHFVRFQIPFQTYIVGDCGDLIDPDDTIFDPNSYVIHVCNEKLIETQIDERTLQFEVLLLVWVEEVEAQTP